MPITALVFLAALAITAVATPWVRRFALYSNFVDVPDSRKLHAAPMPLLGGIAIAGGVALSLLLLLGQADFTDRVQGVLYALAFIVVLGLVDDRRGLPPWAKLFGQSLAVMILIRFNVRIMLPIAEPLNYLLTFVWVLGICNATNFLDNMDGLCVGTSAVAAAFITLIASMHGQILVAALAAATLGACLGFLIHNFSPAKIFMGDAGSMFLGFVLAVLGILLRFPSEIRPISWAIPIFIFAVPLFDTALVLVSRTRRRVNPFTTAGKDHLSHRLVAIGLTQRGAVLIIYLCAGVFGVLSLFVMQAPVVEGYGVIALIALGVAFALWWLEWRIDPQGRA